MFTETCVAKYADKLKEIVTQNKAVILSSEQCVYCNKAKKLFQTAGVPYHELKLDTLHPNDTYEIVNCIFGSPEYYVPYIYYDSQRVGGYGELQ